MSAAPPAVETGQERLGPAFIKLAMMLLVWVVMVSFDSTMVNVAIDVPPGT